MRVAVNFIPKDNKHEYIYVFDEYDKKLLDIPIRSVNKKYVDFVDINLTDYDIECHVLTALIKNNCIDKPIYYCKKYRFQNPP